MSGGPSYYYISSSCMTTYNENGRTKSSKHIYVDDNGIKNDYHKESILGDRTEEIIKEKGNKHLDIKQIHAPTFGTFMSDFFDPWHLPMYSNSEEFSNSEENGPECLACDQSPWVSDSKNQANNSNLKQTKSQETENNVENQENKNEKSNTEEK